MDEVKIRKGELLEAVRRNRETHRDLFLKAQEGFRNTVIAELDSRLDKARRNQPFSAVLNLPEPQDHTADYDRVIRMIEMSVDDEVVLQAHEFDQYVMDNWSWARAVRSLNASYVK